jgi:hypothetical protein
VPIGTVFTDATGQFRIDALSPGVAYSLLLREMKPNGRAGPLKTALPLKPGETRDLGDLTVRQRDP